MLLAELLLPIPNPDFLPGEAAKLIRPSYPVLAYSLCLKVKYVKVTQSLFRRLACVEHPQLTKLSLVVFVVVLVFNYDNVDNK